MNSEVIEKLKKAYPFEYNQVMLPLGIFDSYIVYEYRRSPVLIKLNRISHRIINVIVTIDQPSYSVFNNRSYIPEAMPKAELIVDTESFIIPEYRSIDQEEINKNKYRITYISGAVSTNQYAVTKTYTFPITELY